MNSNQVDPAYAPPMEDVPPPPAPAYPDPVRQPLKNPEPPPYSQAPPHGAQAPPSAPQAPPPGYQVPPPGQQGPPPAYPQTQYSTWYPTQAYGPRQPPPPGGTVIITTNNPLRFGEEPKVMNCPHCRADITTNREYKIGGTVWGMVGIIILVGLFIFPFVLLGCCFIPCCMTSLKDVEHSCPNCNNILGHYRR